MPGPLQQPARDLRQTLQAGIVASPDPRRRASGCSTITASGSRRPFIAIDSEIGASADPPHIVALRHELLDDIALRA
jgi:hypothetical protein